ncbi:hypothetical protein IAT38_000993 [Cryptococcus sp. DSM 104549]
MPAERSDPTPPLPQLPPPDLKCAICGLGNLSGSTSTSPNECVVLLNDPIERICGRCAGSEGGRRAGGESGGDEGRRVEGLGLRGIGEDAGEGDGEGGAREERLDSKTITSSSLTPSPPPTHVLSQSLPSQHPHPWTTSKSPKPPSPLSDQLGRTPSPSPLAAPPAARRYEEDRPADPLVDLTQMRVPNAGRGALYPGSVFKGTQTSGRSAYDVEVRFLDVNFPESSLSGYLSISNLTDSHPYLTTFFTGEIIGPKYGFITGTRFGATEHDDMRHWGRFEQFRRPSTRQDMMRPELLLRDPQPDRSRGETKAKERDFVFLRIKERFLVPDHKVRDISGASFAGFYFAMVDLSCGMSTSNESTSPTSPEFLKSPTIPTSPSITRRQSSNAATEAPPRTPRSPTRPDGSRRRESSTKLREGKDNVRGEATIRGYYFHSLNQEPFQELFLTHVPQKSSSTFEFR